jgi:hypothetical protein
MKMDQTQRHMKMEQTDCSKTSAHKYQTPGNYPKERIQPSQHDESKKSRKAVFSAINPNMAKVRKFRVMYVRPKVLEIGRIVGMVLAVIDVLFQLALVVWNGRSSSNAVPETLEEINSLASCFEDKHFKL